MDEKSLRRKIKTLQHRINKTPKGRAFSDTLEERKSALHKAKARLDELRGGNQHET